MTGLVAFYVGVGVAGRPPPSPSPPLPSPPLLSPPLPSPPLPSPPLPSPPSLPPPPLSNVQRGAYPFIRGLSHTCSAQMVYGEGFAPTFFSVLRHRVCLCSFGGCFLLTVHTESCISLPRTRVGDGSLYLLQNACTFPCWCYRESISLLDIRSFFQGALQQLEEFERFLKEPFLVT